MGGDELLRSVARFQRDMLRKREEQGVKLTKDPKSMEDKGKHLLKYCDLYQRRFVFLYRN